MASARYATLVIIAALAALTATVSASSEASRLMDEISNAVNDGLSESRLSTGALMHAVRNTGRALQANEDGTPSQAYPKWALPQSSYEGDLPKWSRYALNERINTAVENANERLQEAYTQYDQEYCTEGAFTQQSEWVEGKFSGGSCSLTINLGGCYVYPIDGPDKKSINLAVNCTTPQISFDSTKARYEGPYKSPTEYAFKSCRGKSITLGEEKTNYLQYPGNQFAIPFFSMPAKFPGRIASWMGLPRPFK